MNQRQGLISYFVHHPVAANLMLLLIVCMGLLSYNSIQRQTFPLSESNKVTVRAIQLGASAKEIEENILLKIEQALKPQVGVKRIISTASPSRGRVEIQLHNGEDMASRLDEIKLKLDSIATFPSNMDPLLVYENVQRQRAFSVVVSGLENPVALKQLGDEMKDELLQLKGISYVDLSAMPDYEVAIEVLPNKLREYNLTLSQVVSALHAQSDNLSAGQIKTASGNIYLRLEQRQYFGAGLAEVPILTGMLGEKVYLKDIANIKDGFKESLNQGRFNGKRALYIMVLASKEQSLTAVVDTVKPYIERKRQTLPSEVDIYEFVDVTYYLDGRLNMMLTNLAQGAILVFIVLAVFLRTRLALWVMVGLPVAMLGAFWLMPFLGITINLVSLFAFIMVLGIVVDDAIVIGESVCDQIEHHGHSNTQVILGAQKVAMPATFGVLTTIAVFMPFMLSTGPNSGQFIAIAGVCILCLFFSLIESKLILPAHLAATPMPTQPDNHWRVRFNNKFQQGLYNQYVPLLTRSINHRYAVIIGFVCLFVFAVSLLISGQVRFTPIPKVPHDYPSINIQMNHNVSEAQTLAAVAQIEDVIQRVERNIKAETGKGMVEAMYTRVDHLTEAEVVTPLIPEADRPFDTFELARRWREQLPSIPGVKKLTIESDVIDIAEKGDLQYQLFAHDIATLQLASKDFIDRVNEIQGVHSVFSSLDSAQTEYQVKLKPLAHQLQLTARDVTQQVSARFYGIEMQRVMRDGQEVVFMVKGVEQNRERISALERTVISLKNGEQVFFGDVAETVEVPGISVITREQGHQVVTISANVDQQQTALKQVSDVIEDKILPELSIKYPELMTQLGGDLLAQRKEQSQVVSFAIVGLLVVYLLLALPLQSYVQPLIVMSVIPFSLVGALWGHYFLGYSVSMMSIFGIVAAAGVVINDSLVMTDVINKNRTNGLDMTEAVIRAGVSRFRAILLTSLTTFLGLVPIMFESSLQAQFVIPTAISLSFSVVFATVVTLVLVPCLYVVIEDIKRLFILLKSSLATQQA
ncbi:efflux RND transporter permease subunit [Pseudoalteromonas luteoviolacea]|uniref:efflux RND transporter permease subunit n=1 Tax=Pseudoalteromonas luteoviolacea TaxID=43657 RepID=UPI001B39777A|nr:efflux RND transporter permease subunit [Pseudoalteromonas luteoviolacea]MBQ4837191.1 efflux RND transporter permease subunit [Pseudoalteromonas luteoviolacea]